MLPTRSVSKRGESTPFSATSLARRQGGHRGRSFLASTPFERRVCLVMKELGIGHVLMSSHTSSLNLQNLHVKNISLKSPELSGVVRKVIQAGQFSKGFAFGNDYVAECFYRLQSQFEQLYRTIVASRH